jgi:hypothetical protein
MWDSTDLSRRYILSFFFFFDGTGVRTQGFALSKQVLYPLNHASNPFFSVYFGVNREIVLDKLFAQAGLNS